MNKYCYCNNTKHECKEDIKTNYFSIGMEEVFEGVVGHVTCPFTIDCCKYGKEKTIHMLLHLPFPFGQDPIISL